MRASSSAKRACFFRSQLRSEFDAHPSFQPPHPFFFLLFSAHVSLDVTIEILCTFNKLKGLTTDVALIAQAAQESELLALDASRTRIKRVKPLPSNTSADPRIVYAVSKEEGEERKRGREEGRDAALTCRSRSC
jgi:hypothetical protein